MPLGKARYEAVVVGTGFGGAVAACRLAQAGVDVAVLERGRRFPPGSFPRDVVGDDGLLWHRGAGLYDIRPLNDMLVVQAAGYGGVRWSTPTSSSARPLQGYPLGLFRTWA